MIFIFYTNVSIVKRVGSIIITADAVVVVDITSSNTTVIILRAVVTELMGRSKRSKDCRGIMHNH